MEEEVIFTSTVTGLNFLPTNLGIGLECEYDTLPAGKVLRYCGKTGLFVIFFEKKKKMKKKQIKTCKPSTEHEGAR